MPQLISDTGRLRRKRMFKDKLASYVVGVGGIFVIFAIALIFFYFLFVVFPLFEPANQQKQAEYNVAEKQGVLSLAMEEQTEIGAVFSNRAMVRFFDTVTGETVRTEQLLIAEDVKVSSFSASSFGSSSVAYGLSNGHVIAVKHKYDVTYPEDKRLISPGIEYPLGEAHIAVDFQEQALINLAYQDAEDEATLIAQTADKRLLMVHMSKQTSLLDDEVSVEMSHYTVPLPAHAVDFMLLDKNQRNLYLISKQGELSFYDVTDKSTPRQVQQLQLTANQTVTTVRFLTGDLSILVGDNAGTISQWAIVPDEFHKPRLKRLRQFVSEMQGAITDIAIEPGRKGFLAVDDKGYAGLFHSTAHRTLLVEKVSDSGLIHAGMAPRANAALLVNDQGQMQFVRFNNEHPEISWQSLWGKVWYESYSKPEYIWQSSAASDDFEPKFSLTPITFGTMKAAFYAMLIAIPLSIFGALYTAQFMRPRMRKVVKPTIEIMEALPTVILGFLAGLWLAPFVESHLPGIFTMLLILPLGILVASFSWEKLPSNIRHTVPEGWEAALLLPVVAVLSWLALNLSPTMEQWWFGGDMRSWLTNDMGIGFDQRNAVVVGLAMGFAVIPTIFSIAEDAIFGVPKHLSNGSLAMGATSWQTLMRIVLPSASPGIFSGVMIGFGRAVGETMIVLMATGNTPVMDFSPFEGLRTLSANIAVELPESEVDSTHYRVLFLAGLVLFAFTFFVNTIAELVRQRLRQKYSNL